MIQDLEVAKYFFENNYAPKEWKKERFGWTLDEEFEKAKNRILQEKPLLSKDYHKIFKDFLNSTRDYHVGFSFYSTEMSIFPLLEIKSIDGHYYISSKEEFSELKDIFNNIDGIFEPDPFDETLAEMNNFSEIEVGDELIAFNGISIDEVINKLIEEELTGEKTPTNYALAQKMLFDRMASYGMSVSKGNFQMTLKKQTSEATYTCTLPWIHFSEWVNDGPIHQKALSPFKEWMRKDYSCELAKDLLRFWWRPYVYVLLSFTFDRPFFKNNT